MHQNQESKGVLIVMQNVRAQVPKSQEKWARGRDSCQDSLAVGNSIVELGIGDRLLHPPFKILKTWDQGEESGFFSDLLMLSELLDLCSWQHLTVLTFFRFQNRDFCILPPHSSMSMGTVQRSKDDRHVHVISIILLLSNLVFCCLLVHS